MSNKFTVGQELAVDVYLSNCPVSDFEKLSAMLRMNDTNIITRRGISHIHALDGIIELAGNIDSALETVVNEAGEKVTELAGDYEALLKAAQDHHDNPGNTYLKDLYLKEIDRA